MNNRRQIYHKLKQDIEDILLHTDDFSNCDEKVGDIVNILRDSLLVQRQVVNKEICLHERESEWDRFTIAFFGETNAGKSTLIESLRIIGNEEQKINDYKIIEELEVKYNKLSSRIDFLNKAIDIEKSSIVKIDKSVDELLSINNQISDSLRLKKDAYCIAQKDFEGIENKFNKIKTNCLDCENLISQKRDKLIKTQERLKREIEKISRRKSSLFFKIKIFFYDIWGGYPEISHEQKLELEKEIYHLEFDLRELSSSLLRNRANYDIANKKYMISATEIEKIQNAINQIETDRSSNKNKEDEFLVDKKVRLDQLNKYSNDFKVISGEFEFVKEELSKRGDGIIIGTGKQDFTTGVNTYHFKLGDLPISLVDVPGIEGDELKFEKMIRKALIKAHLVFYVNGSGKNPEKNTLVKIKNYLHHQAEIISINNVRGKADTYEFDEDQVSLENTHKDLSKVAIISRECFNSCFDKKYVGNLNIQGLMAFVGVARKINPLRKELIRTEKSFLEFFPSKDDLVEFSNINSLQSLIVEQEPVFKDKIRRANLLKLIGVITDFRKVIESNILNNFSQEKIDFIHSEFEHYKKSILREISNYKNSLSSEADRTRKTIEDDCRCFVYSIIDKDWDKAYKYIDSSNYHCRSLLENVKDFNDSNKLNELIEAFLDNTTKHQSKLFSDVVKRKTNGLIKRVQDNKRRSFARLEKVTSVGTDQMITIDIIGVLEKLNFSFDFNKAFEFGSTVVGLTLSGIALGSIIPFFGNIVGGIVGAVLGIVISCIKSFFGGESKESKAKRKYDSEYMKFNSQIKANYSKIITDIECKLGNIIKEDLNQMIVQEQKIGILKERLIEKVESLGELEKSIMKN